MKILYFDLGLYKSTELKWMVQDIFPDHGIIDFEAHGFEACRIYAAEAEQHFHGNNRVHIHHIGIGGFNGPGKLYHAPNKLGHSIFSSKNNVNRKNYEVIVIRKFSTWLQRNEIDLKSAFVIMKVNIEGAELELFRDLVAHNLLDDIDVVCGAIDDVKKIRGYNQDQVRGYYQLLNLHNVDCMPYTEYKPHTKEDMRKLIGSIL